MLESDFHRPNSHYDFTKVSGTLVSNITGANSREELLRHQWLTELQDLQSDMPVCQQAIFGIPGQLTASGHSMDLDQLNLAVSLAHCHAQLEAAFAMVPQEVSSFIPSQIIDWQESLDSRDCCGSFELEGNIRPIGTVE